MSMDLSSAPGDSGQSMQQPVSQIPPSVSFSPKTHGGSSSSKESEPVNSTPKAEVAVHDDELLEVEAQEAGLEMAQPVMQELPPDLTQIGITLAQPSVSGVVAQPSLLIQMPLTDEQIEKGLHEEMKSSWRWLAEECIRRLKIAHILLKQVHGKLVRMPYRY